MRLLAILTTIVTIALVVGCATNPHDTAAGTARKQIEMAVARSVEATRTKDIEAYMAGIPDDLAIHDHSGHIITKAQLRTNTLRDWSIIPKTLSIRETIDQLDVKGDTATVVTSQRWERLMLERNGKTTDTVLTTQKHRETWRRTTRGWFAYEIEELGGEVFVNGKRYKQ